MNNVDLFKQYTLKEILEDVAKNTYEANGTIYYSPKGSITAHPIDLLIDRMEDKVILSKNKFNEIVFKSFNNGQRFGREDDCEFDYRSWKSKVEKDLGLNND